MPGLWLRKHSKIDHSDGAKLVAQATATPLTGLTPSGIRECSLGSKWPVR